MRCGIAGDPKGLALVQAILVLAVERRAATGALEDLPHALVVGDEQRAGGRAHEDLDARGARQAFEFGNVGGVLVRAADPKGEIAVHAMRSALHLVGEGLRRCRQRMGVGHFEHGRHAAEHGGA